MCAAWYTHDIADNDVLSDCIPSVVSIIPQPCIENLAIVYSKPSHSEPPVRRPKPAHVDSLPSPFQSAPSADSGYPATGKFPSNIAMKVVMRVCVCVSIDPLPHYTTLLIAVLNFSNLATTTWYFSLKSS